MIRERKIEIIHDELQDWKSYLQFIEREMVFIKGLINSYMFEPKTEKLFDRLETFKKQFTASRKNKKSLNKAIKEHENGLGGIFECSQAECDNHYYEKHQSLKEEMTDYIKTYIELKNEVYDYAGSILKKRKPMY
ncbi:hypothetical protein [Flagellimonas crocea]|uniref:hypothetical protein n=1 Tax=Flagellimonas crocea TaxID=3067311 RepID=UPI00296F3C0B|nr:hypothetical protein [Muricauda sp. DH64]